MVPSPCRLLLDADALVQNWRLLAMMSGRAACGAAVKADSYGLGARAVVTRLAAAGCRDFFVATWREAAALADVAPSLRVLHGLRAEDLAAGLPEHVRPVLSTPVQVTRWREAGKGACDVMVDTGMNRLGISPEDVADGLLDGLMIETLMSHLACADEDSPMNEAQRACFAALTGRTSAQRMSLANSAGIALGEAFAFNLTRPGLALYGGAPRAELSSMRQVATPAAQVLQRRRVRAGETVGYNATWTAPAETDVAILNIGYADGYRRALSNVGATLVEGTRLPVLGRVSMDLLAVDVTGAEVGEGDWVSLDYDLPRQAALSGVSQYELLTGLGDRLERVWR